ncbi:MAG: F0F1 ATP synthase subunit gamma [Burkholderiales bacterium]|nr:F0F1 ATP synthase subunit gamma [Burkholderiales bacterium]MDE2627804.1 F0F1 ATP synthase subunit gamma [Burkholderiales bacterium]
MTSLAELAQRHARLQQVSGIMTAMKSLSLVETRKLARFIDHQRRMRANIEAAAADFLQFHRATVPTDGAEDAAILVLIGSERGFCGNFNERIVQALARLAPEHGAAPMLVVGRRLGARLGAHAQLRARIDGATVVEEVPQVLRRLVDAVHELRLHSGLGRTALRCLAHDAGGEPVLAQLLPLPGPQGPRRHADPPQLQLSPAAFYGELIGEFLLAALYGQLYDSLAAENHQRLAHMENALERLDQTLARLRLRRNALRQERVVEEIEVMLANAMAFDRPA